MFFFESVFPGGLLIDREEVAAALSAPFWSRGLRIFFQVTPDRPRAARRRRRSSGRAVGRHPAQHHLADRVGGVRGIVAIAAGMVWGSKLGVQFSISLVALKALPVLILGGFTSIPGAIVGGLIIGAGEKLAEVMLGPS